MEVNTFRIRNIDTNGVIAKFEGITKTVEGALTDTMVLKAVGVSYVIKLRDGEYIEIEHGSDD